MSETKWTPQQALRRPSWLDEWQDYPHGSLDEAGARQLSGYSVRLEDYTRELYAGLEGVMALITEGKLVRDTSDDPNPDWAMRQLPFVRTLAAAETALAKARGEAPAQSEAEA